jgi:hypothetical protein
MMLRATLSFSKKVPVPGQKFSSQSYHLALESELPDGMTREEIRERLHQTFELVKQSVESELNGSGPAPNGDRTGEPSAASPADVAASNKQVKFITDLASQAKLSMTELADVIRDEFGVDGGVYALSRRQATQLITELKNRVKVAA